MNESAIQAIGMESLASAAKSDAEIARMLQAAAEQNKAQSQADKVTISQEAIKRLEESGG
jgi:hypothetical protein